MDLVFDSKVDADKYLSNAAADVADKAIAGQIASLVGRIIDREDRVVTLKKEFDDELHDIYVQIEATKEEIKKLKERAKRVYEILDCDEPVNMEKDVTDENEGTLH